MVKGLDFFREHFREYSDRYVLIGGAACDLAMREAGLDTIPGGGAEILVDRVRENISKGLDDLSHILKGKIVGDSAAPTVSAKLNSRHLFLL